MENIFNIKYNAELNKLEIPKEGWTSRLKKNILKHKFLFTIINAFFILSGINCYLIVSFMKILQNI